MLKYISRVVNWTWQALTNCGQMNTTYSYSAVWLASSHFSPPGLSFLLYKIQIGSDAELCYLRTQFKSTWRLSFHGYFAYSVFEKRIYSKILIYQWIINEMKWGNIISSSVILPVLLFSISCLGFITDGNSKLVGGARIRQVRVKGNTCPISPKLQRVVQECHAPYSLQTEDTSVYGEHWNTSVFDNSSDLSSAWQYQSQSKLRGHASWGKLAIYRGGGYVIHLGTDPKNASRYHLYCKLLVWRQWSSLPSLRFILDCFPSFPAVHCAEYCRCYCGAIVVVYVPIILLHAI